MRFLKCLRQFSLYQLERDKANDVITQTLKSFNWFIFLFYGECLDNAPVSIDSVPLLAELAAQRIAVIDFLPTNDHTRNYLYGSWRQHCPSGIDNDLVNLLQHSYELNTTDHERQALERLFYMNLFRGDSFQPSLALVNVHFNYMIKRNFTYQHDQDLQSSLMDFIVLAEDETQLIHYGSPHELGELFNPKANRFYNPHVAPRQSIERAFANFLDSAEDALYALSSKSEVAEIESLRINTTDKFMKAFKELSETIRSKAIAAIKKLASQPTVGLGLEKINLSSQISIYRMRITKKYRIHFQGTPTNPVFINIGAHRLSDYGYTVD
jgi:mRNA-degrading endonuclease RelE of RelBE toxin-antitoxin system